MMTQWTRRAAAALLGGIVVASAGCGGETTSDGGLPPTTAGTPESIKATADKINASRPGAMAPNTPNQAKKK